jgi:hypothetical protein
MKKTILNILIIVAIIESLVVMLPAYNAFISITSKPDEWMGGVDSNMTILWFVIIFFGFGFLLVQTVLAIFGVLFAREKRRGAFFLFKLPAIIGLIIAIIITICFVMYVLEWQKQGFVLLYLILPMVMYLIYGNSIRKRIPKRTKKTNTSEV